MPSQLTFDLPSRTALGRDEFFVSPANSIAVETVGRSQDWPNGKLVLVGPRGSGKTHLVHVWAAETGAAIVDAQSVTDKMVSELASNAHVAVEDVDTIAGQPDLEEALFHLHNAVLSGGGRLLMTTVRSPGSLKFSLPDLTSRFQGTNVATLQPPDDMLLAAILVKLFSDRQLAIQPKIISFLVSQMDRSFGGAQRLVAELDKAALAERRAITKPLATRVLNKLLSEEA